MTYDPTTKGAWLVKGETELGPQRRCEQCRDFWPLTPEFWRYHDRIVTHKPGRPWPSTRLEKPRVWRNYHQPCLSCRAANTAQTVVWVVSKVKAA